MPGIEALTLQFVDAPSASANVLMDLNNRAPLFVMADGWSAPPPQKNVTSFSSSARDGANVAQESYADRELGIRLGIKSATNDEAAEYIQKVARLFASEQWLRYGPNTIEPVYFRCHRGEIESIDEFNGQDAGTRVLNLRIPAEYAAYGEAVTGSTTIANNPTAATNPMSYLMPAIQGDVSTDLAVKVGGLASHTGADETPKMIVASSAHRHAAEAMRYSVAFGGTTMDVPWTEAFPSDSNAVGGTYARYSRPSGSTSQYLSDGTFNTLYRGDYRVLLRARASVAGSKIKITPNDDSVGQVGTSTTADDLTTAWRWLDFGVFRLPPVPLSPELPSITSGGTLTAGFYLMMSIPGSTAGTIDIDRMIAIPAGLDDAVETRVAIVAPPEVEDSGLRAVPIFVDSINGIISVVAYTRPAHRTYAGGLPTVVPGRPNALYFVRAMGVNDLLADTFTIDWFYYPKYLYIRSATT